MTTLDLISPCLCGSKKPYQTCCHTFHVGAKTPETAEQLMRSRFTAYALHLEDYLLNTWAKSTRPGRFSFEEDLQWIKLKIIKTKQGKAGDEEGTVLFKAFYQSGEQKGHMTEKSRFERDENQQWVYVDGIVT
jgi:SEC-C motif-containing protein